MPIRIIWLTSLAPDGSRDPPEGRLKVQERSIKYKGDVIGNKLKQLDDPRLSRQHFSGADGGEVVGCQSAFKRAWR
jgi:hypothetical protein